MLQSIARSKDEHTQFLAAIYGKYDLLPDTYQTARAQQYDEDLQELMKFDDQVWILEMSQAHFPNIIADADAAEEFVKIDFSKIKKDEFTAKVPPPGDIGDTKPDTVRARVHEWTFLPIADH